VNKGLSKTLSLLTKTKNEAAIGILIPALDSARVEIQEGALQALLDRHSDAGQREIVRRLHQANDRWVAIIDQRHGRMTNALRDAVLATNPQLCANGCRAVLWFHEYDLLPALVNAAEEESNPNRQLVSTTLLRLAELLYDELASPRDYRNRRDPQLVRQHVFASLENSVRRYPKHRVGAVVEAFLLLAHHDNATLKQILADPLNPTYRPIIELMTQSPRTGVIRLVLNFLDDPQAPTSAITVLAHRSDARFVECLARKIGSEPSAAAAANMKKIESISWLQSDPRLLEQLDGDAQAGVVQLATRSGMSRRAVFATIDYLLQRGSDGGRRAASAALAQFNGAEANALCLRALADRDPEVQANAARQLRSRGVPGALTRLVELTESPHDVVRRAVRESLAEFTFKRFLASFDMLEPEARRGTGAMVWKIDHDAAQQVAEELAAKSRTRRLRAIATIVAMEAAPDMERQLIERLGDEDHVVRAEAARVLAACKTPAAHQALVDACGDRSVIVQEAAEESLRQLQHAATRPSPSPWQLPPEPGPTPREAKR